MSELGEVPEKANSTNVPEDDPHRDWIIVKDISAEERARAEAEPGFIPIMEVRPTERYKRELQEKALMTARAMGLSDDEWERYRVRPGEQPYQRDLSMLIDPERYVEIMREGKD